MCVVVNHSHTRIFRRSRSLKAVLVDADNSCLASAYGACREPPNRPHTFATLCVQAFERAAIFLQFQVKVRFTCMLDLHICELFVNVHLIL